MSDNWALYYCYVEDMPATILVDAGVCKLAPIADLPSLVWLRVYMQEARDDGFPNNPELQQLRQIEDAANDAISVLSSEIAYVGRKNGDATFDLYFYASNPHDAEACLRQAMIPYSHEFDTGSRLDAEWETYFNFLYPTPRDWQRISNQRTVAHFEQAGDDVSKPREVDHFIYFQNENTRDAYQRDAMKLGFAVKDAPKNPDESNKFLLHLVRNDLIDLTNIDDVTLTLFDLAEDHAAEYDGWGAVRHSNKA